MPYGFNDNIKKKFPWAIAVLTSRQDVKCRFDSSFHLFLVHSQPLYVFLKGIQSPKLDIFALFCSLLVSFGQEMCRSSLYLASFSDI